jgi:geranylgeranyl reductase family protein
MEQIYDVAVVGAGPGGSAAAHYLAASGLSVLLLDKSDFPRDKTCGDGLTPRALSILDDMGILEEATQAGFRVNGLELHAKGGASMTAGIPLHPEYPDHLLIVPRLRLDDIIRHRALESGAHFESPVRVLRLKVQGELVEISAERDGRPLNYKARVAILAIGANMRMLQEIGLLKKLPRTIVAVRAYYEGMQGLNDRVQAHFDSVPMPGYGWIFPIGKDAANVGIGMWRDKDYETNERVSLRAALDTFLASSKMKPMMAGARLVGPIKSYPLRIDFTSAPTYAERILLVGETAGLVSPLTGEGIDFALETGRLAAEFLRGVFASGDFSPRAFAAYDRMLRKNFQSLFRFLGYLRHVYVNPFLLDRVVKLCERMPEVKELFVGVLMSQRRPTEMLSPAIVSRVVLGV